MEYSRIKICFLLGIVLVFCGIVCLHAQSRNQDRDEDENTVRGRDTFPSQASFEKDLGLYELYAAYAVRQKDTSLCKQSDDPTKCAQDAEFFQTIMNVAQKKCSSIENTLLQKLCYASQDGCSGQDNPLISDFCSAIDQKDTEKLKKVSYNPEWTTAYGVIDDDDAQMIIGVYHGARANDVAECVSVAKDVFVKTACKILYDTSMTDDDFRKTVNDLRRYYRENTKSPAASLRPEKPR